MATETVINRPAPFVETLGEDLAKQVVAQTGVPLVTQGIGSLTQQPGETAEGFKARQDAARAFTTRQQSLAGLAPTVAGQDALQQQAQTLAQQGVGSFQPFLTSAQQELGVASGLGTAGSWTIRNRRNNIRWYTNRCSNRKHKLKLLCLHINNKLLMHH